MAVDIIGGGVNKLQQYALVLKPVDNVNVQSLSTALDYTASKAKATGSMVNRSIKKNLITLILFIRILARFVMVHTFRGQSMTCSCI